MIVPLVMIHRRDIGDFDYIIIDDCMMAYTCEDKSDLCMPK